MSPWLFNIYMDAVLKEVNMGMGRRGEWKLPGLLYADNLVLFGESEVDLKEMVGHFVEVCRRGLKVNADIGKLMVLCTDVADCRGKVVNGRKVAGAFSP